MRGIMDTTRQCITCLFIVFLVLDLVIVSDATNMFNYKRYPWRKKQRNQERKIRALKKQCEEREECQNLSHLDMLRCVRTCMSPTCYEELYAWDEIEEGEIDGRYNSYKGCIIDKLNK